MGSSIPKGLKTLGHTVDENNMDCDVPIHMVIAMVW